MQRLLSEQNNEILSPNKLVKRDLGSNNQTNNVTPMMNKVASSGGLIKMSRGGSQQAQNVRHAYNSQPATGQNAQHNKFQPKPSAADISGEQNK